MLVGRRPPGPAGWSRGEGVDHGQNGWIECQGEKDRVLRLPLPSPPPSEKGLPAFKAAIALVRSPFILTPRYNAEAEG